MLQWQAHSTYTPGKFVIGNASGTNCLFQLQPFSLPFIVDVVDAWVWDGQSTGPVGMITKSYPTDTATAIAHSTGNSLSFGPTGNAGPIVWNTLNGAGETTGTTTPFPTKTVNFEMVVHAQLMVPVAGQYKFVITHHDGMLWGIGGGASKVSGNLDDPYTNNGIKQTVCFGYPILGGTNRGLAGGGLWTGEFVVNFPTSGVYPVEIDYAYWYHSGLTLDVTCNGNQIAPGPAMSGTTQPTWPSFSTSNAPSYATVTESAGQFIWANLGPVTDFVWHSNTSFTTPNSTIIDANGYIQAPFRTGVSGSSIPSFSSVLNALTNDNPNLIWINQGLATSTVAGTITTRNGGWQYAIALVDTLDSTVSNATPLSTSTGNFVGAAGVQFSPGSGLPSVSDIDPQCDYVAIFRTTDGQSVPFLIPGTGNSTFTMTLSDYLNLGFTDTTLDTDLNNLISAPTGGQNTPPATGAINLMYHLNRIFFSVGNVVYWTAGPDTPVGNGVNGVPPLNYSECPSLVKRLVPITSGVLVFTVSDIFLISGQGTAASPLQTARLWMQGIGLENYDALDVNGSLIGMFTTDNQFLILDPSSGASIAGFPIGDQLRQNNGVAGTSWDSTKAYVTWHVDGEDQAWYLGDGQFGWYRLCPTPAPEIGYTWSAFATIQGQCKAIKSVEVSPGVHKLLVGSYGTGPILNRDLGVFQDNGQSYPATATIGSAVLVQPGQVALVSFITTESIKTGTPMSLGVLIDEALPYYKGPIEQITAYVNDPPGLPESNSILGQRFYLSDMQNQAAACRHMQIQINWIKEPVQNELLSLTVFGGFEQEG